MSTQPSSTLWANWVLILSVVIMGLGFGFAIMFPLFLPQVIEPFFTELSGMTWADLTIGQILFHNLLAGVIGGVLMGWGLLLALLSLRLRKAPEDWIWTTITISVLVWYLVDTTASIFAGSTLNVLLNSGLLIATLPPILAQRESVMNGFKQL
jgi:hypothetical protein